MKELIPEFYCFPPFLANVDDLPLGTRVRLPVHCLLYFVAVLMFAPFCRSMEALFTTSSYPPGVSATLCDTYLVQLFYLVYVMFFPTAQSPEEFVW